MTPRFDFIMGHYFNRFLYHDLSFRGVDHDFAMPHQFIFGCRPWFCNAPINVPSIVDSNILSNMKSLYNIISWEQIRNIWTLTKSTPKSSKIGSKISLTFVKMGPFWHRPGGLVRQSTHLRILTHLHIHASNLTHLRIPSSYRTTFQVSV